jgi:hypothetical protein
MPKGPAVSRPNDKHFYSMSLAPIPDLRLVALAFRKQIRNDFPRKCHTIGDSEYWSQIHPFMIDKG